LVDEDEVRELEALLPEELRDFVDVFSPRLADRLPDHTEFDHPVDLEEGATLRPGPCYQASVPQLRQLRDFLDENMARGFIRPSSSRFAAPTLFAKKKDGPDRICHDYRRLNAITIKNRHPIPRINTILDRLAGARYCSNLDLRGAYNLIRIRAGDEWKTAFRTPFGLFEYLVMPFGLCNAPATFQKLMNFVFRDMDGICLCVYLDDILIFTTTWEEHVRALRTVLTRLRTHRLFCKLSKCHFFVSSVTFLGYRISSDGVSMDPEKIAAIVQWPLPRNAKEVASFVGLANFYRNFVKNFSTIARALHDAIRSKEPFRLTDDIRTAWSAVKDAITSDLVMRHFDPNDVSFVETDASDYALGAVFSQQDSNNVVRPVAFISRKLTDAEINYPTHDKELLAIVWALNTWRHYLLGCHVEINVVTDHRALEWFTVKRLLSRRQARWSDELKDFVYRIRYIKGPTNTKADALSRRADHAPLEDAPDPNWRILLPPEVMLATVQTMAGITEARSDLLQRLKTEHNVVTEKQQVELSVTKDDDGILRLGRHIYVPDPLTHHVIASCHDDPTMGHPGRTATLTNVATRFWWPTMRKDVEDFVKKCDVCQRTKVRPGRPYGHLLPLPVAERPWQHISADFVGPLPPSNGFNSILVFVDRFSKMAIFVPTTTRATAKDWATMFFENVFRRFGLPSTIVTDRGSLFTSVFWTTLVGLLGTRHNLTTAYHPQTDGQTEIVNKALVQYLRIYGNYAQSDWASLLPHAEFWYNSNPHSTTGISPLQVCGIEPRRSFDEPPTATTGSVDAARIARRFHELHKALTSLIQEANDRYAVTHDRHRQHKTFKVGDNVLVTTKNLRQLRPSPKLADRYVGPFKIIERVNDSAYRLQLPEGSGIHNTFNVDKLREYHGTESGVDATNESPPFQHVIRVPTAITDRRIVDDQQQWCVTWEDGEKTWQTDESMSGYDEWARLKSSPVTETDAPVTKKRGWHGWVEVPLDYVAPPDQPVQPLARTRAQTAAMRSS
jgi:hypothetical protein